MAKDDEKKIKHTPKKRPEEDLNKLFQAPGPDKMPLGYQDRQTSKWLGYGIELAGVLFIFSYAGYWADQKQGHQWPWLMVIGFAIGFTGMLYLLIKETRNLRK